MTWVVVREDNDWKIASHHVSPKTAPKQSPPFGSCKRERYLSRGCA
ncbi:hypothetical protein [Bradyrhizobium lablabi]